MACIRIDTLSWLGGSPRELSSVLNPMNTTQLADGIMGMSAHPSTLPRAMYDQGKPEHSCMLVNRVSLLAC